MKKTSIIILILAAVLAVVLLVFDRIEIKHDYNASIKVTLLESAVPEYYRSSINNSHDVFDHYGFFVPKDEEIETFHSVWHSYEHESGWPFSPKKDYDLTLYVENGTNESFYYNSDTGYLCRSVEISHTVLEFEIIKPVFKKTFDEFESYSLVSGEDKDKLDAIVAEYRKGLYLYSSIILERTLFDPDSSEGKSGIDLSSTFYIPDSEGRIPEIPEPVTEYLKKHYRWCAVDSVRTFNEWGYKNDSVYILNIRVRWDETHDMIFVLEYDAQSGALYSSEFEDIDPENGAKYSPFYDEIFICPKIRKVAESVFPAEQYSSYYGSVVLYYLPDDPYIRHIPVGMTYAEFEENCSDEDIEIKLNMFSETDGAEFDLDAVKEFMVIYHIDYNNVKDYDNYIGLRRQGNWVYKK